MKFFITVTGVNNRVLTRHDKWMNFAMRIKKFQLLLGNPQLCWERAEGGMRASASVGNMAGLIVF